MSARPVLLAAPHRVLDEAIPGDVLAAIDDPDRLSPMLAGVCRVRGNRLTVRTPGEDIEVEAPAALLDRVFTLCDGTRTVADVLDSVDAAARSELAEFVRFLLGEGALIDANLACVHAARYAFQGSPMGLAAESRITNRICRRFSAGSTDGSDGVPPGTIEVKSAPLDPFLEARISSYTFDEGPLAAESLHTLLWSLAGVVRRVHERVGDVMPRRTVASAGGMQLIEVYVALQRAVGDHTPGVYRVHYPDERKLALAPVSADHGLVPRAFTKPWELQFATGAVFLAADPVVASLRYRNRALQYLFMEAGAVLHNGGLSADALGLGFATIGGYYESTVAHMCRLGSKMVLGSAIFGPRPTPAQRQAIWRSPDLEFAWVDAKSERFTLGFHLARARVKTARDRPHTWGRGADPWMAVRKAVAEAVEREGFREPRDIAAGAMRDVESPLDPCRFVRYGEAQYRREDFPYQPFDPSQSYPWARGRDVTTGKIVHVLGELVFSRASLAEAGFATPRPYAQATTSGCAAGTSHDDAVRRALLEVIERDAFMRHWLQQRPGTPISRAILSAPLGERVDALAAAGCKVRVQLLESKWAHVALAAAQHPERHFTTMGTAANANLAEAIEGALDEIEARVYAWLHDARPTVHTPQEVTTTEHHFELYGLRRYFRRADRVLFPAATAELRDLPQDLPARSASELADRFAAAGIHPVAVDITPRECFVDQGRTRLEVVKAMIPGLLPVSFGFGREPLGMVARAHRASSFPHPFP